MIDDLLKRYPLISDQVDTLEVRVILTELQRVLDARTPGAVVEFGCYVGTTSLFIRRLLDARNQTREFHVYDSFAGLPPKRVEDSSPAGEQFQAGELSVSKKDFLMNFKKASLIPPVVHKGWFEDIIPVELPDTVAFAFLDGDYYDSIKHPLCHITPKLSDGAIIVVDDYANEALPGARKATDEWCRAHIVTPVMMHSLAIIRT